MQQGIQRTSQNMMDLSEDNSTEFPSLDIGTLLNQTYEYIFSLTIKMDVDLIEDPINMDEHQIFDSAAEEIPPTLQDNHSGIPMDFELDNCEDGSDSDSIVSNKRELLLWDSEESSTESNELDHTEREDENDNPSHLDTNISSTFTENTPPLILQTQPQLNLESDESLNADEEDKFTTPALSKLKKELLGDYKPPSQPPSEPFHLPILNDAQKLSLKHYSAWQKSNGTVKAYNYHASVLAEATGIEILSLYKVESLAESLTGLHPCDIDMCPKSCIAYTGKYSQLKKCEYISSATKERCDTPRYAGPPHRQ